jgi:TorA maturation chaperone TorD
VRGVIESLSLLSKLWLREPDAETLAAVQDWAVFAGVNAEPDQLASAYIDLFLLNVYPYGTVFTDPSGELNGRSAWDTAKLFEAAGFLPRELSEVGAPDHVGLCLAFLGHLAATGRDGGEFVADLCQWLPVCALAVLRESSARSFYQGLARATLEWLFSALGPSPVDVPLRAPEAIGLAEPGEEVHLSDVVRFLLACGRSGFFLSRSRLGALGREAGLALPFASRFEVARTLFVAAGETGRIRRLLELFDQEISGWESAYRSLGREHAAWRSCSRAWIGRLDATRRSLGRMREVLDSPLELGYDGAEVSPRRRGP